MNKYVPACNCCTTNTCGAGCDPPTKTTLSLTDSVYGARTLTWTGSFWQWIGTVNFPGSGACAAKTGVYLRYTLFCQSDYALVIGIGTALSPPGCPVPAVGAGCAMDAGAGAGPTITCSPFTLVYTGVSRSPGSLGAGCANELEFYQGLTPTFTATYP